MTEKGKTMKITTLILSVLAFGSVAACATKTGPGPENAGANRTQAVDPEEVARKAMLARMESDQILVSYWLQEGLIDAAPVCAKDSEVVRVCVSFATQCAGVYEPYGAYDYTDPRMNKSIEDYNKFMHAAARRGKDGAAALRDNENVIPRLQGRVERVTRAAGPNDPNPEKTQEIALTEACAQLVGEFAFYFRQDENAADPFLGACEHWAERADYDTGENTKCHDARTLY